MGVSELEIELGSVTMNCTPQEIGVAFESLLHEIRSVARLLRPDERVVLRKIMAHDNCSLTVRDVFHEFYRDSEAHKTLRRLRAAQFVRPWKSGRWDRDERIEVKPFARLLWERIGEAAIFSVSADADEVLVAESREEPISLPATTAMPRSAAKEWEDDDVVLDLAEYAADELRGKTE